MLRDVRRQPRVLAALLARASDLRRFGREHLVPDPGGTLFAVGCGDGWFACRAADSVVRTGDKGYRARSALPFLLYDVAGVGPGDRVLVISMSGNVDRTVEAARAARARKTPVAILTNGAGGRLGSLGLPRLSLDLEPVAPFLCGTTSYTATVLALMLALGPGRVAGACARIVGQLESLLDAAHPLVRDIAQPFPGVRFLSSGINLASADYGAAKLVELTRIPAWSDDVEEFAHRQFWNANPGELVVFLAANDDLAEFANASATALARMGFTTVALETHGCAVPGAAYRVPLPMVDEPLSPIPMALPLQLLGYELARATNCDPDMRRHLTEDRTRFDTSRRLTRRSLIGTGQ